MWSNRSPATILAAYGKLVDQMRASNPGMRVLVAQIIPMAPSECGECGARVVALNDAIPAWAAAKSTGQSPVVVVDQWTGFGTAGDTYDGVHPNASGDQKMSNKWYPALTAALGGTVPPPPTPTPTPTVIPTPTPTPTPTPPTPTPTPPTLTPTPTPTGPPPAGSCAANYRIIGQWQGGFQGHVIVTNTGTATTSGWTVRFALAPGQQIDQSWNATLTQSGNTVTARNVGWNGNLIPGASTTFGFIGTWSGDYRLQHPVRTRRAHP